MKTSLACILASITLHLATASAVPRAYSGDVQARDPSPALPAFPTSLSKDPSPLGKIKVLLEAVPSGLASDASEVAAAFTAYASILSAAKPTATPTDVTTAQHVLSSIFASDTASPTPDVLANAIQLIENSFSVDDFSKHLIEGSNPLSPLNSFSNDNRRQPASSIYPSAGSKDAPYSLSENALRGAIHIPDTFTYGSSRGVPLIFVPGTGAYGGSNFEGNMIKLLQGSPFADVLWLNIPGALLGDIQDSAEYVAYAVNYVYGVTGKKVALASWSQGSLDIAWAMTFWPSIRHKVEDVINYSGDYRGTVNAYALCPGFPKLPCDPSVIQQGYNSSLIQTLQRHGGGSAYVPTTSIYSSFFDEIVQPQTLSSASGFIRNDRGVGVTNAEIQSVCSGRPGGGFYTHEGVMLAPLAYYLTVDAITHPGPGSLHRIDLSKACGSIVTDGLSLSDVFATEATIPIALLNLLLFTPKTFTEPPIRDYAK